MESPALLLLIIVLVLVACVLVGAALKRLHSRRNAVGAGEDDEYDGAYDDVCGGGKRISLLMRDPHYTNALEGKKTVEARVKTPLIAKLKSGDTITIARSRPMGDTVEYSGKRRFPAKVISVSEFPNFDELLKKHAKEVAPGFTPAAAAKHYREFDKTNGEKEHKVVAIEFASVE